MNQIIPRRLHTVALFDILKGIMSRFVSVMFIHTPRQTKQASESSNITPTAGAKQPYTQTLVVVWSSN